MWWGNKNGHMQYINFVNVQLITYAACPQGEHNIYK